MDGPYEPRPARPRTLTSLGADVSSAGPEGSAADARTILGQLRPRAGAAHRHLLCGPPSPATHRMAAALARGAGGYDVAGTACLAGEASPLRLAGVVLIPVIAVVVLGASCWGTDDTSKLVSGSLTTPRDRGADHDRQAPGLAPGRQPQHLLRSDLRLPPHRDVLRQRLRRSSGGRRPRLLRSGHRDGRYDRLPLLQSRRPSRRSGMAT